MQISRYKRQNRFSVLPFLCDAFSLTALARIGHGRARMALRRDRA
jgi:hypothetical protein